MSEHVIQNPVPTPEQMAKLLGVSPARVEMLRTIMRSGASLAQPSRDTESRKIASKVATPVRQFKMRKKTGSGAKISAR